MEPENGGWRITVEQHTTVVSFLLDETGSMQAIKDDTVGGFNAYLDTLQTDGANIVCNLVSFNSHETRSRYVAEPINTIRPYCCRDMIFAAPCAQRKVPVRLIAII